MYLRRALGLTVAAMAVLGCSHAAAAGPSTHAAPKPAALAAGSVATAGAQPMAAPKCTLKAATMKDADAAKPGDVVCFTAPKAGQRLTITKGGTAEKPVTYSGDGTTEVGGITIEANYVIVQGYKMTQPQAPGIEMTGNNITLQNNTVTKPTGDDGDGLRFFGNNLKILHNTISQTDNSTGAHADCMQTFQSGSPSSEHVTIDSNRCEQIDNMCVMAEGPNDGEGDGQGVTQDWTFTNNFCQTRDASQDLMFEDVQHLTINGNEFSGSVDHAIGLDIGSTYAHVGDNKVDPSIQCYVGLSDDSREGYQGPKSECQP
jgi:hypothetical protein